jgi:hypothetical protein
MRSYFRGAPLLRTQIPSPISLPPSKDPLFRELSRYGPQEFSLASIGRSSCMRRMYSGISVSQEHLRLLTRPCPFSLPHVAYEGRGLELWAQARAGCLRRRLKGNCTWQAATLIRIGAHKYISGARRNRDRQLVLHNRVIRVRGLARDPKSSPLSSRYRSICGSGHPSDRSPRAIGA